MTEQKVQCRLKILIYKQIKHLLDLYPETEWSGVAFYNKIDADKYGWTKTWSLEAFYPIDLGSGAATEFSGEDQIETIQKAYKENPKLKECYKGLIHSHHTLSGGAFFSGTDRGHMEECANKVGYPSLVVAAQETESPFAFSFSWTDNFNKVHWTKEEEGCVSLDYNGCKPEGLFKDCLNSLEKQKKEKVESKPIYLNYGTRGQTTLFNRGFEHQSNVTIDDDISLFYDKDIKDRKYQKLLKAYLTANQKYQNVSIGSPNLELCEQRVVDTEKDLDDYCLKHGLNDIDGVL